MKTPRILARLPVSQISAASSALGIASLLLTSLAARAVTDTWDGGGVDDNIWTALNWLDNTAPVSNLNTTDLIFGTATSTSLTPNFSNVFSAHSITIDNVPGVVGYTFSGTVLNVGTGGIVNNDARPAIFNNAVDFGGVLNSSVDAAMGALNFSNAIGLPTGTLTVAGGGVTSFLNISGSGTLSKTGAGLMFWSPTALTNCDVIIDAGTVFMFADGTTDIFTSSAAIEINGSSILNLEEDFALNGAQLTRASGAQLNLDAGKTLTVQSGGDVTITGNFTHSTASTIAVSGAGSTFSTTGALNVRGGSTMTITNGGSVSTGSAALNIANTSLAGATAVTANGVGASVSGGNLNLALNGGTGSLTFLNGSTGDFEQIAVASSGVAGSNGTLLLQNFATLTGTSLTIASNPAAITGTVTITGPSSALTISGAGTTTIGAASASSGTLNVNTSGTFHSGTGLTTVHPTGTIAIAGGTFNANGDLTLNGGQLTRGSGTFALAAGKTLTVQAGGEAMFTGAYTNSTASTILVTGAGSTFSTTSSLGVQGGAIVNIAAAGSVSSASTSIGTLGGDSSAFVDGAGSSLSGGNLVLGGNGFSGSLTFTNGSTGMFTTINVDNSSVAGSAGALRIQTGASVIGSNLLLGQIAAATLGTLTIAGAGSALKLTGTATIGAESASTAVVNVQNGGTFTTGTGQTTVNATGDLNINAGGTMIVRGNMTVASSLDIANGGSVIVGGGTPAPGGLVETGFNVVGDGDIERWESSASAAAVPEPGIGALLLSALALLGARRRNVGEVCNLARRAGRRRQGGAERTPTGLPATSLRSSARGCKPRLLRHRLPPLNTQLP